MCLGVLECILRSALSLPVPTSCRLQSALPDLPREKPAHKPVSFLYGLKRTRLVAQWCVLPGRVLPCRPKPAPPSSRNVALSRGQKCSLGLDPGPARSRVTASSLGGVSARLCIQSARHREQSVVTVTQSARHREQSAVTVRKGARHREQSVVTVTQSARHREQSAVTVILPAAPCRAA